MSKIFVLKNCLKSPITCSNAIGMIPAYTGIGNHPKPICIQDFTAEFRKVFRRVSQSNEK